MTAGPTWPTSPGEFDPPPGTRALLFDCDGTLVDTMGLYRQIWAEVFERHGFALTAEWWGRYGGIPLDPFVLAALPHASERDIAGLRSESIELFHDRLHLLEPLEHVIEVARRFHGVLPMAVCSGSFRPTVHAALDAVGITGLFDHVLTADDVLLSKPAPDLYLLGMARLGVTADQVVVFEDSDIGMTSARSAGVTQIVDARVPVGAQPFAPLHA